MPIEQDRLRWFVSFDEFKGYRRLVIEPRARGRRTLAFYVEDLSTATHGWKTVWSDIWIDPKDANCAALHTESMTLSEADARTVEVLASGDARGALAERLAWGLFWTYVVERNPKWFHEHCPKAAAWYAELLEKNPEFRTGAPVGTALPDAPPEPPAER